MSSNGDDWILFNASPDLRQQINDNEILHPRHGLRDSPIKAVVLTNADVDHVAGLLSLRESQPLQVYGTGRVLDVLAANSIFNVLNPQFVARAPMALDRTFEVQAQDGRVLGIVLTPFAVPGKVALWLEDAARGANFGSVAEDTIALEVRARDGGQRMIYMPACAEVTAQVAERLRAADLVFFDGTLWVDDEMIRDGVGVKSGKRMGHMSVSGPDGTMAALANLGIGRKIFIHINTTNPILLEDSSERRAVTAAGWEVASDGMEIEL